MRVEQSPVTRADMPFLLNLYVSTRIHELNCLPWTNEEKHRFARSQFLAQHSGYTRRYINAAFDKVTIDGADAGRFYVDSQPDEIRVLDISLLPHYRKRGVGTHLMQGVMQAAGQAGKPVRLHVQNLNAGAKRFYHTLRFSEKLDRGTHILMEWRSDGRA